LFPEQLTPRLSADRGPFEDASATIEQKQTDWLHFYNVDVSDWVADSGVYAHEIRSFRPSLFDKKHRILHDELLHLRQSWIFQIFKQMCTLKFMIDPNCDIDESDIEKFISPLGDISSIDLIRTVDGRLKGMFTVTFINSDTAKTVKKNFGKIAINNEDKCSFPIDARVDLDEVKQKQYVEASLKLRLGCIKIVFRVKTKYFVQNQSFYQIHSLEQQSRLCFANGLFLQLYRATCVKLSAKKYF
jgi:hypothetical protein